MMDTQEYIRIVNKSDVLGWGWVLLCKLPDFNVAKDWELRFQAISFNQQAERGGSFCCCFCLHLYAGQCQGQGKGG